MPYLFIHAVYHKFNKNFLDLKIYVFFANTDTLFPLTCPASKNFQVN